MSRLAIVVGAGALAVAGVFVRERGAHTTETLPPPAVSPGVPPAAPPRGTSEAPPATAAITARPSTPAAPVERAQVVLLGDGTLVAVDGTPRGACPARVALDPGTHSVVFSFPPTGESKGESFVLRASEHRTLRADFTGVTPTIRTDRGQ